MEQASAKARMHDLDLFFSLSLDLLCIADFDGRYLRLNPAWQETLGFSIQDLQSRPYIDFVHPEDREKTIAEAQRLQLGGATLSFENRYRCKDGSYKWLRWSCASDPTSRRLYGIARNITELRATDITEQKKLEQFLRAQRLETLGKLASDIAHDLNNVLAPINMAMELIRMKSPGAGVEETLDLVDNCVSRGADLIRQVLTFARGVHGERVAVLTRHLLLDTAKVVAQTLPKSITIHSDIPRDLWSVQGDPTQIHQVLMNLCVNARDAMTQGGRITIGARNIFVDEISTKMNPRLSPGPYVVIEIQDTGQGIPSEIRDKVFEPFFTTKESKGTGIGLSIVAALVRNHGGFINLYSEVGRGTSFKIYFPALTGVAKQSCADEKVQMPVGNGELILIVDDEAAVRDIAKLVLETHGYRVVAARDGAEGLAVYAQHVDEIRLVISDLDMHVMSGAAMIDSLERINPNVRVISASGLVCSGLPSHDGGSSAFRQMLPKPYTASDLLRTVDEVIRATQGDIL